MSSKPKPDLYLPQIVAFGDVPVVVYLETKGVEKRIGGSRQGLQNYVTSLYNHNRELLLDAPFSDPDKKPAHIAFVWELDQHVMTDVWSIASVADETSTGLEIIDIANFRDTVPDKSAGIGSSGTAHIVVAEARALLAADDLNAYVRRKRFHEFYGGIPNYPRYNFDTSLQL